MTDKSGFYAGLVRLYGETQGQRMALDVDARLQNLILYIPRQRSLAVRMQFERNILPGVALYRCLLGHGQPAGEAVKTVEKLLAGKFGPQQRIARMTAWLPSPFAVFRFCIRQSVRYLNPPEGWTVEWRRDTAEQIDFDITRCIFLDTVSELGHPELVPAFCRMDDHLGVFIAEYARFERHGTLAEGAACCDFSYQRVD